MKQGILELITHCHSKVQIGCVFVEGNDCAARSNGRGLGVLQVEKELGERRAVGYSGVGLGVSAELNYKAISEGANDLDNVSPETYWL